jgi:hypothetical protein
MNLKYQDGLFQKEKRVEGYEYDPSSGVELGKIPSRGGRIL